MEISTWYGDKATLLTPGKLPNSQIHMSTLKSPLEMIEDALKGQSPNNKSFLKSLGAVEGDTAEDILQKWDRQKEEERAARGGPSQEELDRQTAKQRARPVHSVFRRGNGEILGFLRGEDGSFGLTSTSALGSLTNNISWNGSIDVAAEKVKELAEQFYGFVQVDTYPPGSGMTVGRAGDEMFGRGPRIPPPDSLTGNGDGNAVGTGYAAPRRGFSAETLALFQDARKSYGGGRF